MTSIIKLQPLSGVYGETPYCYVLQVDEFRFLLDCGWDEFFSHTFEKELKKYVSQCCTCLSIYPFILFLFWFIFIRHLHQIDAVLLSYPDHLHLGALPYSVGKCGLNCPIYATIPVYKMGQMFMYDLYQVSKIII